MIEPQVEYFEFLKTHTAIAVEFVDYKSVEEARGQIQALIADFEKKRFDNGLVYEEILEWLN